MGFTQKPLLTWMMSVSPESKECKTNSFLLHYFEWIRNNKMQDFCIPKKADKDIIPNERKVARQGPCKCFTLHTARLTSDAAVNYVELHITTVRTAARQLLLFFFSGRVHICSVLRTLKGIIQTNIRSVQIWHVCFSSFSLHVVLVQCNK